MKFCQQTKDDLIELLQNKKVGLEGNILKLVDTEDDPTFAKYVEENYN